MSTANVHLQCLCGAIKEPGTLLAATNFPIETELCHCNVCRRVNGGLGGTFARLKSAPSHKTLSACTKYARPGVGKVERYFCSTCGSRLFDSASEHEWFACSGVIEAPGVDNVVKIMQHTYVGDTMDGGMLQKCQRIGGRDIECYEQAFDSGESPMTTEQIDKLLHTREIPFPTLHDSVTVACHCEAVKFKLLRPESKRNDFSRSQRWLRANNTKYLARFCGCRSCRLAYGFALQPFAYAPPENIVTEEGRPIFNYDSNSTRNKDIGDIHGLQKALPHIQSFRSSVEARRSFCGKCGAVIFYEHTDRPEVVDIGLGLLRSSLGSLAEDWTVLEWANVSYAEEAVDKDLLQALQQE